MLFRILILGLLIYWAFRIVTHLFSPPKSNVEVKGTSSKTPLDLSDQDVEDVEYKEIKDKD